jgi:hypothetical protein
MLCLQMANGLKLRRSAIYFAVEISWVSRHTVAASKVARAHH